jgi:hypothetical protein
LIQRLERSGKARRGRERGQTQARQSARAHRTRSKEVTVHNRTSILAAALCAFATGNASAMQQAPMARQAHDHPMVSDAEVPGLAQAVAAVLEATQRFESLETALAEGWTNQYPEGCASSDEGAQAFHYLNPSLVDGQVDLLQPELFMYEPQADGSMELVGVDYVIPFDQWSGEKAPTLLGQPMMRNEPLGVWALHIWAQRENPSGTFAPWNPDVSCRYAR